MKYFLALVVCLILSPLAPVVAAEYSVTPLILEHTIAARDIFEETIKITNTGSGPLRLYATVNAVTVGDTGEIQTFVPASMNNNATSATSWVEVSRKRLEIAPNETIKVPITVHVSPNAEAGEYHVFIGFPGGENRDQAEAKVMQGTAPGTILRLSLEEKRNEYLRLQRFSIPRFITNAKAGTVTYDIENVGSVPLTPAGEIIFYDGSGIEQSSITVNPEARSIRPQSTEHFTAPLPDVGYIGRHKAYINIEYGTKERTNVYDTVYFNVIPLMTVVLVFVILLVLSVIITLIYHRKTRGSYTEDEETVSVFVRSGASSPLKDHDINLKQ